MYPQSVHWKRRMGGSITPGRGMLRMTFILQPQRGQGVSVVWSSPIAKRGRRNLPYDESRQGILDIPSWHQST